MQSSTFSTRSRWLLPTTPKPSRQAFVARAANASKKKTTGATKTAPQILTRVEELKLLSQIEKSGLLSRLDEQGLTLKSIEQAGLLSKAESLGLLSAASSTGTPTLLYFLALLAVGAGGALVYFVPDDSTASVIAQLVGAGILLGASGAAFFGGNFLSKLQS